MEPVAASTGDVVVELKIDQESIDAAEAIFDRYGLTVSDAFSIFIRNAINLDDLPYPYPKAGKTMSRDEAVVQLRALLDEGKHSLHDGSKVYTTEEVKAHFGV